MSISVTLLGQYALSKVGNRLRICSLWAIELVNSKDDLVNCIISTRERVCFYSTTNISVINYSTKKKTNQFVKNYFLNFNSNKSFQRRNYLFNIIFIHLIFHVFRFQKTCEYLNINISVYVERILEYMGFEWAAHQIARKTSLNVETAVYLAKYEPCLYFMRLFRYYITVR